MDSIESGDLRKSSWIDSTTYLGDKYYYPFNYKTGTYNYVVGGTASEYVMVLRLAEQYLVRAEVRAQQGTNLTSAAGDINILRTRAGLAATPATTKATLLSAVFHERQIELFAEWGHRWLDLKRNGTANAILSVVPIKAPSWSPNWLLYPIPGSEITADPFLTQTPGYAY